MDQYKRELKNIYYQLFKEGCKCIVKGLATILIWPKPIFLDFKNMIPQEVHDFLKKYENAEYLVKIPNGVTYNVLPDEEIKFIYDNFRMI